MGKDIPNVTFGTQEDYARLFFSDPKAALVLPITIGPGFGVLKAGTALSFNDSAAGNAGNMLPYDPTATITGAETAPGRAYLVSDTGTTSPVINVTIADSYKFVVGDDLILNDNNTAAENLGAILSIDRTTYTSYAVITATTNIGGVAFTTARFGYVTIEGYDTCDGILDKSVDTGTGSTASGANASIIVSNATLYNSALLNVDSAARTDLSATVYGNKLVVK